MQEDFQYNHEFKKALVIPFKRNELSFTVWKHYNEELQYLQTDITDEDGKYTISAARIVYTRILGMKYDIDSEVSLFSSNFQDFPWFEKEFHHILRSIHQSPHHLEYEDKKIIFIEHSNLSSVVLDKMVSVELSLNSEYMNAFEKKLIDMISASLNNKRTGKTFAILNVNITPRYMELYPAIYQGMLRKPGETWLNFIVSQNEFPSEEQMESIDGYIISGSAHSVTDEHEYLKKLEKRLNLIYEKGAKIIQYVLVFSTLPTFLEVKSVRLVTQI